VFLDTRVRCHDRRCDAALALGSQPQSEYPLFIKGFTIDSLFDE
jgi:hypothetical protein